MSRCFKIPIEVFCEFSELLGFLCQYLGVWFNPFWYRWGGNFVWWVSELEGKAEWFTLGTLQQPPCPAVTLLLLLLLPTPLLLLMPLLALWSRNHLHPDSHCHSSEWNNTKGTCRSCFTSNTSFFPFSSTEWISQASFSRFVLARESPGMMLHPGSAADTISYL